MHSHSKPKILVVDDRPENLIAMRHILGKVDGEVVCANSGNEALKSLLRQEFAVVLMDVQMPEMNGFETAELIRGNEDTSTLPIIFVTAINKEKRYLYQGYKLGAVDYLFKPFDPEILRYKVSVFTDLFTQRWESAALAYKNQLILDSVKEGVLGLNIAGEIIFCNPAAALMLNSDKAALDGKSAQEFLQEDQGIAWRETDMYIECSHGRSFYARDRGMMTFGRKEYFDAEYSVTPMVGDKGALEGFVLVFNDISAQMKAERQLEQMAEYDPLTGLANRRLFHRLLPNILSKAHRFNHKVALLSIDIDHFKSVNETHGHAVGDLLLSQFAARLKLCLRDGDLVVRLSGDEFVVVVEGQRDDEFLSKLARTIIHNVAQPFDLNGQSVHCTVSIGIAVAPDATDDANELIKAADTATFSAKHQGRNNYQFFDPNRARQVSFKYQVESHLQKALLEDEFHLVYQPKVELQSGGLTGFEALLRWNSSLLGVVSPAAFIPIAEDSGRIDDIGDWVLSHANSQLLQWSQSGVINDGFRLSVNFSFKQLNNPEFLMRFDRILKESEVDPSHIDIEITETTLMSNPNTIVPLLRVLSEMGMTISVDDFGTGYSSLNYLKILPIHILKIDQSFIKDLFRNNNSEIITRSIINLAHNLELQVVAEGVETRDQSEFLQHYGCDFGQGYLYGKPMLPEDAVMCFDSLAPGTQHMG